MSDPMRVWTTTDCAGIESTGTCVLVVAPDIATARKLIEAALERAGMPYAATNARTCGLVNHCLEAPFARVLCDGDY